MIIHVDSWQNNRSLWFLIVLLCVIACIMMPPGSMQTCRIVYYRKPIIAGLDQILSFFKALFLWVTSEPEPEHESDSADSESESEWRA